MVNKIVLSERDREDKILGQDQLDILEILKRKNEELMLEKAEVERRTKEKKQRIREMIYGNK